MRIAAPPCVPFADRPVSVALEKLADQPKDFRCRMALGIWNGRRWCSVMHKMRYVVDCRYCLNFLE